MPHLDSVPLKTLILGLTSSAPKFVYTSVSLWFRYLQTRMKKSLCIFQVNFSAKLPVKLYQISRKIQENSIFQELHT